MNDGYLFVSNVGFLENIYEEFLKNPEAVDKSWHSFFSDFTVNPSFSSSVAGVQAEPLLLQGSPVELTLLRVFSLIKAYRLSGHLETQLDPLGLKKPWRNTDLDPASYGIDDLETKVNLSGMLGFDVPVTIKEIIKSLRNTYCASVGFEFMHMSNLTERQWIQERVENCDWRGKFTLEKKKAIFQNIMEAELFENFLQTKYPGAKRFSLEGAEAMMVCMEKIIESVAIAGVKEILIGMPHRGRLNVLTKVMGKSYDEVFYEFQGNVPLPELSAISGDVKYHLGLSTERKINGDNIHLSLSSNPSHLEAVNPVVLGKLRGKKELRHGNEQLKVMGIVMHGDAAYAGQGVVYESMVLSALEGYEAEGVVHVIVNNQVGFTTDPSCSCTMKHPSFIAKSVEVPVFHVNGDDPEAVDFVAGLASDFRNEFKKDVVVDLVCYRRYGHNEADEPRFTQPAMYRAIDKHPTPSMVYEEQLLQEGMLSKEEYGNARANFKALLESLLQKSVNYKKKQVNWFEGKWSGFEKPISVGDESDKTGCDKKILQKLAIVINNVPRGVDIHPKVQKMMELRAAAVKSGNYEIDWANAEALAFASLVKEGVKVRLSGQDCCRGTFSQRHAVVIDQSTGETYTPIKELCGKGKEGLFEVINSPLSEYAVLGFEYGYSLVDPRSLVLWEAQFGDFVNGAQIMIDQFIVAAEAKWLRSSGLVMLLPHGYEGQGPEHSSGRLERFLQLCAEDNIQVVNCTTPANYFHVLRRQLVRNFRKPLVIFTPKSLLRNKSAVSCIDDFEKSFLPLIEEADARLKKRIRKVILCSGKVYYDLMNYRQSIKVQDVAILRIEQLYPFPQEKLISELKKYNDIDTLVWCQEEPQNMGVWFFIYPILNELLVKVGMKRQELVYAGRPAAASTAVGYMKMHVEQHNALLKDAFR